jgi:hypothetical protein
VEWSEFIGDFEEFLYEHFRRYQSGMWTAMPLVANQWNLPINGQNTVHATPGIAGQSRQPDGSWAVEPMPQLPDVPVHWGGGGGAFFTHPISQGDEGIGIFTSRCRDAWWQVGGANVPRPDYGNGFMHEIGDGIFIPTRLSNANALVNVSQTSAQLRNVAGTSYFEMLLAGGGGFNFVTPGGAVRIDGSGNLTATGEITRGFGGTDAVNLGLHTHAHGPVPDPGS